MNGKNIGLANEEFIKILSCDCLEKNDEPVTSCQQCKGTGLAFSTVDQFCDLIQKNQVHIIKKGIVFEFNGPGNLCDCKRCLKERRGEFPKVLLAHYEQSLN